LGNSSPYADPVASQKFYRTKVIVDWGNSLLKLWGKLLAMMCKLPKL
jgi:hypothetical protein